MQPLRALLVEDSVDDALFICHALEKGGFALQSERVQTPLAMRNALERQPWDIVICDYKIGPGFTGQDALKILQEKRLDIPFIIVSGMIGEDKAVEAMRSGANDYIMKDPRMARLSPAVRREIQDAEARRARRLAEDKLQSEYALRDTIEKTIPSGIAICDMEGKITYVNPAFCNLVGWSEPNLLGSKPPYLFWPAEEANAYLEDFWTKLKGAGDLITFEARFRRSNGEPLYVLILSTRVKDRAGLHTGWLSSFTDITQRKRAEQGLHELNMELEKRVEERTADLNRTLGELQQAVAARTRLEIELLEIVEKERQRLGLELHDDLGQRLSGLVLMIKGLELKLEKRALPETKEAGRIRANIEEAINLTKGMARNLVPWNFGAGSLVEALKSLAAQNKKMFAVACDFKARGDIPPFPPEKEMHLYKIAQEAVSNGIKHGKASKVHLRLIRSPKELVLRVKNDGLPFPAIDKLKAGAGLRIMNYRANVIGGKFEIHTSPQDGTEVVCTLPLDEPARPNQPRPQAGA